MCQNICDLTQRMLLVDLQIYQDFIKYKNLKELLTSLYINQALENHQNYDGQYAFKSLLYDILNILNQVSNEEKKNAEPLFQLLFEDILFLALRGQCASYIILKFFADFLNKYDLKKSFECDLNIFNVMNELVGYIKSQEFATKNLFETQMDACYYIIYQYLQANQDELQYFGQDLGLVEEILQVGIFQAPSLDRTQRPKYTNKNLIKKAFDMLSLLSRNENNLVSIINFLSPIHRRGIWRKRKKASWNLSSNVKRRTYQYAGLKNLGCSNKVCLITK